MRRRTFLAAAALLAPASAAWAQGLTLSRITAENDLESAFLRAIDGGNAERTAFRNEFLSSQVALALANQEADSPPRLVQIVGGVRAAAIFTSASRLSNILGPAASRVMLTGRAALQRVEGDAVINYRLLPMLTLQADDVDTWLGRPPRRRQ